MVTIYWAHFIDGETNVKRSPKSHSWWIKEQDFEPSFHLEEKKKKKTSGKESSKGKKLNLLLST